MTPMELLQQKRDAVLQIAARHGAYNIRIFGSVARGEAGPDSDIDLLINRGPITSSWFPAGLVLENAESQIERHFLLQIPKMAFGGSYFNHAWRRWFHIQIIGRRWRKPKRHQQQIRCNPLLDALLISIKHKGVPH